MIVADTSALVSLATTELLELVLDEFDVHTTQTVCNELENTAAYEDSHGDAAQTILDNRKRLTVHQVEQPSIESSRIDTGEATCIALVAESNAAFLITDDLRALPELQALIDARVAISPIVLRALVTRGVLSREEAKDHLATMAETRDWLGAPIYRRAQRLFEDE